MNFRRLILGIGLAGLTAACASGPRLHLLNADQLYERGMEAFEDEDWSDAIRSLDQLAARYPTDPRIQEVRFRIAEAYFGNEEFLMAASEYVRLATDYPSGEYSDDARYKACASYYNLSPDPELDQEYTRAAIEHCQSVAQYYPGSDFATKAQEHVASLHRKLAEKIYLNGDYYYKRHAYDSSIIYFEDLLEQYPDSPAAPRALLRLVQIYQRLGYREEMEAAQQRLQREYPGTAEADKAREISLAGNS